MICRASKGNASHFPLLVPRVDVQEQPAEWVGARGLSRRLRRGLRPPAVGPAETSRKGEPARLRLRVARPGGAVAVGVPRDMSVVFDMMYGQAAEGWEVIGEPQRWVMDANWKTGADNFGGRLTTRCSCTGRSRSSPARLEEDEAGLNASTPHPGEQRQLDLPTDAASGDPRRPAVLDVAEPDDISSRSQGEDKFAAAELTVGNVGTIFPNLLPVVPAAAGARDRTARDQKHRAHLSAARAQGGGGRELDHGPKGLTQEQRVASHRASLGTFGSSGIFDQDDSEPWHAITEMSIVAVRAEGRNAVATTRWGSTAPAGVAQRVDGNGHHRVRA